jgi:hypothetical protein
VRKSLPVDAATKSEKAETSCCRRAGMAISSPVVPRCWTILHPDDASGAWKS